MKQFKPTTFVETGTYRGDTLRAVRTHVVRSVSIELDETLCTLARHRFRRHPDVEILWGDSGTLLPEVVAGPDQTRGLLVRRPLFRWSHCGYRRRCPGLERTRGCARVPIAHLVLIDDARLFDGTNGYPTLDVVCSRVAALRPEAPATIENDIVVCHP